MIITRYFLGHTLFEKKMLAQTLFIMDGVHNWTSSFQKTMLSKILGAISVYY